MTLIEESLRVLIAESLKALIGNSENTDGTRRVLSFFPERGVGVARNEIPHLRSG
jgi:hypothetical protein